jgi:hypothetical protein
MNAFFKLFENAFANWFRTHEIRGEKRVTRSHLRQYRHHAAQTAYVPAPRKGWHYEQGDLVRNVGLLLVMAATLTGCAAAQIDHVLANLDKDCARHYSGSIGGIAGIGAQAQFDIQCQPSGTTTTTTVTVVPANPAAPGAVPSGGQ